MQPSALGAPRLIRHVRQRSNELRDRQWTSAAAFLGTIALAILLVLCLLAMPVALLAQTESKLVRIAWMAPGPVASAIEVFRQGLRDLGYVEGRDVAVDERYPGTSADALREQARKLEERKVDLIVSVGGAATEAVQVATTRPVVFVAGDPVARGYVNSLARPGGRLTGVSILTPNLSGKRLELLKEAIPKIRRVAYLRDATRPGQPGFPTMLADLEATARAKGLRILPALDARKNEDFDPLLKAAAKSGADGLVVETSPYFNAEKDRLVALAARYRLPAIYEHRDFADAGGLLSYGPDMRDAYRRIAGYVDRILKGAKPADLPVEQSVKFELVVNIKTSKSLGLPIAQSLLSRADHVLQ